MTPKRKPTISLVGWEQYQHYKKRNPPWVKLHATLLTSVAWRMGTPTTQLLQVTLMLLAGRYGNLIGHDPGTLREIAGVKISDAEFNGAINYLERHEFITVSCKRRASKTLAPRKQAPIVETETETETETEPLKVPKGDDTQKAFAEFWKAYPSRGKAANPKAPALKAYIRALSRGATVEALQRLACTAAPSDKHGTEFVPQATTWLNQDRWADEVATFAPLPPELPPHDMTGWRRVVWQQLGASWFKLWIAKAREVRDGNVVTLAFATKFQVDHVRNHHGDLLTRLITADDPTVSEVRFIRIQVPGENVSQHEAHETGPQ